jgi:Ni/Co efflux regulator RcnB
MTIKSTRLALALLGALAFAAPLALSATPADAAPHSGGMMGGSHQDAFHDRNHRPPAQHENRPRQPHGHYRWRAGAWNWNQNQWAWQPGLWIRF